MFDSIKKYLFLHKKVQLPGIGSFVIEQIPARIDNANQQLYSPLPVIRFNHEETKADRHFFEFLASDLKLTELDVVRGFSDLIFKFKNEINNNGSLHLPGIGKLTKEFSNAYSFHPESNVQELYPDVPAVRITPGAAYTPEPKKEKRKEIRKEVKEIIIEEEIVKEEDETEAGQKETWWIYALVLAVISIGALVYYYMQHGAV